MSVTQITTRIPSPLTVAVMVTYRKTYETGPLEGRSFEIAEALPWSIASKLFMEEGKASRDTCGNFSFSSNVRIQVSKEAREILGCEVCDLLDSYSQIASRLHHARKLLDLAKVA